jgi:hypothetical protein
MIDAETFSVLDQAQMLFTKEPMSFRSYRNCPFITRLVYLFRKRQTKKLLYIILPEKNQTELSQVLLTLADVGVHESALKPGAHDFET